MPAIGQNLACAQGEPTREELGRRSNDDATETRDARARERRPAGTSLLPWLDVENPAQPGSAIWILALAATICIGLTYAYFSRVAG